LSPFRFSIQPARMKSPLEKIERGTVMAPPDRVNARLH
jgi:hypothetical protein